MKAIPEGYHTLTPNLILEGAAEAIKLYEKAFGAKTLEKMTCPDTGKIMHAGLQIGSSRLFLSDAGNSPMCEASHSAFYVYTENVDTLFKQAKQAGFAELDGVKDMFWGDRVGSLEDKYGNRWTLATHVRDVSKDEMDAAAKEMIKKMKEEKAA
jgi:PhnB protein